MNQRMKAKTMTVTTTPAAINLKILSHAGVILDWGCLG